MPRSKDELADLVLGHLLDLSAGQCTITERDILEGDYSDDVRSILGGLLHLHEDLHYRETVSEQARAALEGELRRREQLEHRRDVLSQGILILDDGVEITDAAGVIEYVNPAWQRMMGFDQAEAIGKTPAELMRSNEHHEGFWLEVWATIASGRKWHGEIKSRRKDGSVGNFELRITPIRERDGEIGHYVAVRRDLTERLRAERAEQRAQDERRLGQLATKRMAEVAKAHALLEVAHQKLSQAQSELAKSEQLYRTLVESATDAIFVLEFDSTRFVKVNDAACALFGYARAEFLELQGRDLHGLGQEEVIEALSRELNQCGAAVRPRLRMRCKDGRELWVAFNAKVFRVGGATRLNAIVRNVTEDVEREVQLERTIAEREVIEEQLVQATKLAAVGELAGGVAHEINNPLMAVMSGAEFLREDMLRVDLGEHELLKFWPEYVRQIASGAERCKRVTDNLLAFARPSRGPKRTIDVREAAILTIDLVRKQLENAGILVESDLPDPLWAKAHSDQLGQVLLNLITNAQHAHDGAPERRSPLRPRPFVRVLGRIDKKEVALRIEDNGPGMDRGRLARIFEPFFTTKGAGVGTGLGLPISERIVKDHGGRIEVESTLGEGTSFEVILPRADAPPRGRRAVSGSA